MEVPYKTENRVIIWSCNPTPGHVSGEILIRKDTCTPMFIATLFTIAKTWKQPKCPSTDEWMKKMCYICTVEYYSAIKEWNNAIYSNMDGPRDCHTKWSKSDRGRQIYDITYLWNLKNDTNELICKTEIDSQNRTSWLPKGKEGGRNKLGFGD